MAITKHFRETVLKRARKDKQFRQEMLREAINALLNGEIDVAKSLLRDYINATIQFIPLSRRINKDPKSLQRMFGPSGNPSIKNIFAVIQVLKMTEGIDLQVSIREQSNKQGQRKISKEKKSDSQRQRKVTRTQNSAN